MFNILNHLGNANQNYTEILSHLIPSGYQQKHNTFYMLASIQAFTVIGSYMIFLKDP